MSKLRLMTFLSNIFPDTSCDGRLLLSALSNNKLLLICVCKYVINVALTLLCVKARFL